MQDTNNVVNEQVEGTTSETSTTSDSQTADGTSQESASSSSEDVNTQTGEGEVDLEKQALGQVKTDKAANRVQELANRAKAAEAELMQLKQIQQQSQMQYPQNAYQELNPLLSNVVMQEIKLRSLESKMQFQEAEKAYPELDKSSPEYSIDFDDAVYNAVQQEGLSPMEAARKVSRLTKVIESKVAARMQRSEAQKVINSTGGAQRSNLNAGNDLYTVRLREYTKNPTTSNLEKLLSAKNNK